MNVDEQFYFIKIGMLLSQHAKVDVEKITTFADIDTLINDTCGFTPQYGTRVDILFDEMNDTLNGNDQIF